MILKKDFLLITAFLKCVESVNHSTNGVVEVRVFLYLTMKPGFKLNEAGATIGSMSDEKLKPTTNLPTEAIEILSLYS